MLVLYPREIRRVPLIVLMLLLFPSASCLAVADDVALPDFGDSASAIISPQQERMLGEQFMRQVRREAPLISDPEIEDYIQRLGERLATGAGYRGEPTFFMIANSEINAFAVPGGFVGVHSGLLLNSATESEVASVLAHEMVHLTQRHTVRGIEAQGRSAIPSLIAMLGAIAIAAANPEAGQAALAGVAALQQQMLLNYSRGYEQEADRIGVQVLANSGFNPQAMPEFFDKLHRASRYNDPEQIPEYLRTHPVTINRIAEARERADKLPAIVDESSADYALVCARLVVLTARTPLDAKQYFEPRLQGDDAAEIAVAEYGYALSLTSSGEYDRARKQIQDLLQRDPDKVPYLLAAGEIEARAGDDTAAANWYRRALDIDPTSKAALYRYTDILSLAGDPILAKQVLRDRGYATKPEPQYYKILAQAEGRSGHHAEARIAQAEFYYLQGEYQLAARELELAVKLPNMTNYHSQRIKARLAEIRKELVRHEAPRSR